MSLRKKPHALTIEQSLEHFFVLFNSIMRRTKTNSNSIKIHYFIIAWQALVIAYSPIMLTRSRTTIFSLFCRFLEWNWIFELNHIVHRISFRSIIMWILQSDPTPFHPLGHCQTSEASNELKPINFFPLSQFTSSWLFKISCTQLWVHIFTSTPK